MKTLLLPGAKAATIEWLWTIAEKLDLPDTDVTQHNYTFWIDDNSKPDLATEITNLPNEKFGCAIAKSIGSLILLQAVQQQKLICDKAIIFGVPLNLIQQTGFDPSALELIRNTTILVIQQRNDKFGASEELARLSPARLLEIDGSDHLYNDFDLYISDIKNWLANS